MARTTVVRLIVAERSAPSSRTCAGNRLHWAAAAGSCPAPSDDAPSDRVDQLVHLGWQEHGGIDFSCSRLSVGSLQPDLQPSSFRADLDQRSVALELGHKRAGARRRHIPHDVSPGGRSASGAIG